MAIAPVVHSRDAPEIVDHCSMILERTPVFAPAPALLTHSGDLLRQFGADKVQVTGADTITLTYGINATAVNAAALLKDEVNGVKLIVDNASTTRDLPVASANGIADVLRGIAGLDVNVANAPGGTHQIQATSHDGMLVHDVAALVERSPIDGVDVAVYVPMDIALGG